MATGEAAEQVPRTFDGIGFRGAFRDYRQTVPDSCLSFDLRNPRIITSATYQALHGASSGIAIERAVPASPQNLL